MHLIDGGQRLEAAVRGEESEKRVPHGGLNVAQTHRHTHTHTTANSSSTCLSVNGIHLS